MERPIQRAACALLLLMTVGRPALGEPGTRRGAEKGVERSAAEKAAAEKTAGPPVIGCPSLANYRMLMRAGAGAAAATLADPKADHLGCIALPRGRITGIADRVLLGGRSYDCASLQGTTACHWIEAGMPAATPESRPAQPR